MARKRPSRNEIHIGGNASAPVVAGDNNQVKVVQPAESTQTNTAKDNGTLYGVTNGDIHIHHDDAGDEKG
ncbi:MULTISPECIES: hypothetical protein [unclassified Streptomyces]|uniref:hypothetical protein n=1 Tax=unclassified Streptomyces TaxID=2593676 RepID=UPI002DDB404A|nr:MULTISPECIES: hypothetical protein [unclassified Streptomyces]WRZ22505.1 hypothetical protein OHT59_30505 [Streptomyces sp. NBC_00243]